MKHRSSRESTDVFEVEDDIARYWNKLAPAKRVELSKQSRKMNKDSQADSQFVRAPPPNH